MAEQNQGFASITQFAQRDAGTGLVSQRDEPETVEAPADNASTGAIEQQPAEVTYTSLEHLDGPTGAAEQISEPVTVLADYPRPKPEAASKPAKTAAKSTKKES